MVLYDTIRHYSMYISSASGQVSCWDELKLLGYLYDEIFVMWLILSRYKKRFKTTKNNFHI